MAVEFTTTCAIVTYHHLNCEFEPHSWQGVLNKTLCDKVWQWLATGLCISLGTPISTTKVITEIFLKVVLNGQMMDQKFVHVVHNIKHPWVIMWHIFTSTNNTTTILFPTQLWELLCTYHVIKQCTEKETTSLSKFVLTIKLNYLHDLKIMLQCLLHLNMYMWYGWILISCLNWKLQLFICFWIIKLSQNVLGVLTWIGGY
jgi:hypothetical protein